MKNYGSFWQIINEISVFKKQSLIRSKSYSKEEQNLQINLSEHQNKVSSNIAIHKQQLTLIFKFQKMLGSRKEMIEKQRKSIFAKEIVTKNQVFLREHVQEFFSLFNLYADHFRKVQIKEMLSTAKTLGFDKKYRLIFSALIEIEQQIKGQAIHFQEFLTLLTEKLGQPYTEDGRKSMFDLVDKEKKERLDFNDLKNISEQLKFNLEDNDIQEVINNVAGFGRKEITWEQFNKYIARKIQDKKKF